MQYLILSHGHCHFFIRNMLKSNYSDWSFQLFYRFLGSFSDFFFFEVVYFLYLSRRWEATRVIVCFKYLPISILMTQQNSSSTTWRLNYLFFLRVSNIHILCFNVSSYIISHIHMACFNFHNFIKLWIYSKSGISTA